MAKQPESRLQKSIQDTLRKEVGGWWFKVWGGPFTPAGIPDLIGCVDGMFFALEVKLPKKSSKPSPIQIQTIRDIVTQGGGCATIVRSKEEAVNVVIETLARAASRLRLRRLTQRDRTILRTAHRKDLHHSGHIRASNGLVDSQRRTPVRPAGNPADKPGQHVA